MSEINFDEIVKRESDQIAKANKFDKYHLNIKGDDFTGANYTSKIVHVQVIDDDGQKPQINLLFKLALLNNKESRDLVPSEKFFKAEMFAYNVLFPEIDKYQEENSILPENRFKFAKFYKGAQEFMKEFIIMEDLSFLGYELYGKSKMLDFEHSRVVLRTLATYHGASFAMKAKDPDRFAKLKENVEDQMNYPEMIHSMATDTSNKVIKHLKCEKKQNLIKAFVGESRSILGRVLDSTLTEPYNVICHGDLWNNNMLFRQDGGNKEVMFLDFQIIRYATPATDIIYNFYMSADKKLRDEKMTELCDEYYDALGKCLQNYGCNVDEIYPRKVFDNHMIFAREFGILFATMSCTFLLAKPGEERTLDELLDDTSGVEFSPTDQMQNRLEELAADISNLNKFKGN